MSGFAWIEDGNNCGICNMAVAAKLWQYLNMDINRILMGGKN